MSDLRRTPLSRALYRPNLFLGGERELVLIMAILCAGVAVSSLNAVAIAIGLGVWIVCLGLFRLMAKADPQMTLVYLRSLKTQRSYPARSRPFRRD